MPKEKRSLIYNSIESPLMREAFIAASKELASEGKLVQNSASPTGYDFSPSEMEKRRLGAQRLKETLGKLPGYAKKAERGGEGYWLALYESGHRVKNMP